MRQSKVNLRENRNQAILDDLLSSSAEIATLEELASTSNKKYNKRAVQEQQRSSAGGDIGAAVPMNDDSKKVPPPEQNSEELRQLLEIKTKYEAELAAYAEQITQFKEQILELREENGALRNQLNDLKSNNYGKVLKNLEEEVGKWETLYFESAEVGAARMSRLEEELEQLRVSSQEISQQNNSNCKPEHMENLCKALKASFATAKEKQQQLRAYKIKSKERVLLLEEMVEKATVAKLEMERELAGVKSKFESMEKPLLDQVKDLETQVQAKAAIIERERNQAAKREAKLKEQIKKLQRPNKHESIQSQRRGDAIDGVFATITSLLEDSMGWCAPAERDFELESTPKITGFHERESMSF